MATLTQQQLESNIQAMEKQGAPQGDIQAYLNSLKGPQAPSNFGAPAQPTEKKDGFFKTLIKAPLESLLVKPAARATEALGRAGVFGEEAKKGYELSETTGQDLDTIVGRYKVEPVKPGFAGVKQAVGEGLEAGSWLVGGGAAKGVAQGAVRSTIGRGIAQGAKVGAKSGALYGVGAGMQEDKDLGGIVGSGLTGAAVGGVAGGAIGGAFTGARHALLGKQATAEEAATAGGRIFQASSRQPSAQKYIEKTAPKILSKIDTTGVKSYDDLSRALESHVDRGLNEVDEALKVSSQKLPIKALDRTVEAVTEGGRKVKTSQNFVKDALADMEELYTKTRNPAEKLRIKAVAQKVKTEGLSPFEINQLAREYGTVFKKKAFGAQGPLTSVNAVTYENTRKGLKETARSLFEGDALKNLDAEVSNMLRLKTYADQMAGKVTALENRVKDRNIVEKLFRGVGKVADVATFGGPKAFITKLFFPSNVGQKTMNSIDLQNELVKNLRIIRNLEHASDSTVITALRNLAIRSGLIKPTSNFGRVAAPKLGSEAVEKSVAKIPTARYTEPVTKSSKTSIIDSLTKADLDAEKALAKSESYRRSLKAELDKKGVKYFDNAPTKELEETIQKASTKRAIPEISKREETKVLKSIEKKGFYASSKAQKYLDESAAAQAADKKLFAEMKSHAQELFDSGMSKKEVSRELRNEFTKSSFDDMDEIVSMLTRTKRPAVPKMTSAEAIKEWKTTGKKPKDLKKVDFPSTWSKRDTSTDFTTKSKRPAVPRISEDKILQAHLKELKRQGADATNLGWTAGDDFMSSKTTRGKLHTKVKNGKIVHEWDEPRFNFNPRL